MMIGIRGTLADFLFFTATSVGVPSANFLNVCNVSLLKTGSSISAMLAFVGHIHEGERTRSLASILVLV